MPADFADDAQQLSEIHLENSLKKRKILSLPFSGFCLYCGEAIGERRFCDSTCRESHEKTLKLRAISRGV